jgi:pilus assembly protein CpaE
MTTPTIKITAAVSIADPRLRDQSLQALAGAGVTVAGDFSAMTRAGELVSAIDRAQPDVLLLGFGGVLSDSIAALGRIRELDHGPKVIAVASGADPETILQAMRAGAAEFVYPPVEKHLAEALSRIAAECAGQMNSPKAGGQVVGLLSAKGGCGATTLACHISGYLSRKFQKRVLLADLDFSSGGAGLLMGGDHRYHVLDALGQLNRLDVTLWKTLAASTTEGPDFIAAPPAPSDLAGREDALAALTRFWRSQYDYTIVDLGHGLTPTTCSLLTAFDSIHLVTTAEMPALRLAKQSLTTLKRLGFGSNQVRLVVNRMPRRVPIQLPELEKIMGCAIYSTIPNDYPLLAEAYAAPRLLDADSSLGRPLAELAAKLAGATLQETRKRRLALFR